jgi:hypothetical protein
VPGRHTGRDRADAGEGERAGAAPRAGRGEHAAPRGAEAELHHGRGKPHGESTPWPRKGGSSTPRGGREPGQGRAPRPRRWDRCEEEGEGLTARARANGGRWFGDGRAGRGKGRGEREREAVWGGWGMTGGPTRGDDGNGVTATRAARGGHGGRGGWAAWGEAGQGRQGAAGPRGAGGPR